MKCNKIFFSPTPVFFLYFSCISPIFFLYFSVFFLYFSKQEKGEIQRNEYISLYFSLRNTKKFLKIKKIKLIMKFKKINYHLNYKDVKKNWIWQKRKSMEKKLPCLFLLNYKIEITLWKKSVFISMFLQLSFLQTILLCFFRYYFDLKVFQ